MDDTTALVGQLRAAVKGQVLTPADDGYAAARTVYLGDMDQRPAVIVRPAGAGDVAQVVSVARDSGLPFAVKSGGHSVFCLCEGGIVLDLSSLNEVRIDTATRTAWAEPGATAGGYSVAAHEYGLVTGFGDTGSVGLGGITVGGGVGYLARRYGLTIDDLLAAEVVTADGEIRQVDAEHEPDLFWAIRGGGGNFGVVTRMRFRLHELRTVYGGMLVLRPTPEVIAGFVDRSWQAPDELSSIVNVMPAPPMPFLPEEVHGSTVLMAMMVYAGEGAAAERAVAPFRALDTPLVDMVSQIPYPRIYPPEMHDMHPLAVSRNLYVDEVDGDAAALMLARLEESTAVMPAVQIRVLGGAMARVPEDATAFAHRKRPIMLNIAAIYQEPGEVETHRRWVVDLTEALRNGEPAMYASFLADDAEARIREAYPDKTWGRLRAIKRTYDPTNLFRINGNIPPAES